MPDGVEADGGNMKSAALLLAMAIVAAGCNSPNASQSQSPTQSAASAQATASTAGSSEPTPSPSSPAGLHVDGMAQVLVNNLNLRVRPSTAAESLGHLPMGEPAYIVDGPVQADGYQWYQLASVLEPYVPPCGEPLLTPTLACSSWFGWAAAGTPDGDPWLAPLNPVCPTERTTASYLSLQRAERLACAGDDEWKLTAYLAEEGGRGCLPIWYVEPVWLFAQCNLFFPQPVQADSDGDERLQTFVPPALGTCTYSLYQPGCPFAVFKGSWVEITGHLDDPAASTCVAKLSDEYLHGDPPPPPDPDQVVFGCRLAFVATAVRPVAAPIIQ
jgi:hypothetical protein